MWKFLRRDKIYAERKPSGAKGIKQAAPQEGTMERMRIRPYRSTDCENIKKWISDEESHMKWCANFLPFRFTTEEFDRCLEEGWEKWGEMGYTATDEKGCPVGFFKMFVNHEENTGFFKCIIVDGTQRGVGLGRRMLDKAVKYAFEVADVDEVRLIVFDDNPAAVSCYAKVGFAAEATLEPFEWNGKKWGRTRLLIKKDK